MAVFHKKPLQKGNWMQNLMKKQFPENLVIEINNLLAVKPILSISPLEISDICRQYDAVTVAKSQRRFLGYYHIFLQSCLDDKKLTDQEIAELAHLKLILGLPDRSIKQIHNAMVNRLYDSEVKKTMSDGIISNDEQVFLDELSANLLLSSEQQEEIRVNQAGKQVTNLLEDIMADARITPEEEDSYNDLVRNLGYAPEIEEQTKKQYERYKLYWQLENEPLPRISPTINLAPLETACIAEPAAWFETNQPTRLSDFNFMGDGNKFPRNEKWRIGYPGEIEDLDENWISEGQGRLVLTDKRLVFSSDEGERSIILETITNFIPYVDGIRIERDNEQGIILEINKNADLMAILLNRLLSS